ncbi:aldehyde dehydrogenase family protein [Rhodococcus sp. NPDC055112]
MSIDQMVPTTGRPPVTVHCPATGEVVGSVPDTEPDSIAEAVDELRAQQPAWEALGPKGRARWLFELRDWLLDNEIHLMDVLQSETGKPRAEAAIEMPVVAEIINFYASRAPRALADAKLPNAGTFSLSKSKRKTYRPHPVVGVITPWNFPLLMPAMDVIPALLAGAAVILKPSEVTPLSALELARGWREIGAPPVLACVTGRGGTGAAVVDVVDMVQFTGSTATGRTIAARAGERLIPCSVELGGKDAAIVLADADLERAANGILWGGLMNAGQACISVERVYVEASVHDEFVALLTEKVRALRQGADDDSYSADVGALANANQLDIVRRHVDDAIARGATAAIGGAPTGEGTFFEPTVLVDVDHTMACMTEETFGPTIPVMKVADADEAVRLANDSVYGLSATVWTGSRSRGNAVARRLEAGAVNINDVFSNLFCFGLPHGGWKSSGIGARFGGDSGLQKYCRVQAVTAPRFPTPTNEPLWYPYTPSRGRVAARLLRAIVARDVRRRLSATRR